MFYMRLAPGFELGSSLQNRRALTTAPIFVVKRAFEEKERKKERKKEGNMSSGSRPDYSKN